MLAEYRQAIDQHRQRVYSFARYSLRAREDAEDVTQEVFIRLWQHWSGVNPDRLGAWLMRVAHNAVVDHVRKQKANRSNLDHYSDVEELESRHDHDEEQQLDREIFKAQLRLAIGSLDDPFRSILVMRDIQGLSYGDIRESLDLSESQVKVYLHRGRRKLRENPRLRELFDSLSGGESKPGTSASLAESTGGEA